MDDEKGQGGSRPVLSLQQIWQKHTRVGVLGAHSLNAQCHGGGGQSHIGVSHEQLTMTFASGDWTEGSHTKVCCVQAVSGPMTPPRSTRVAPRPRVHAARAHVVRSQPLAVKLVVRSFTRLEIRVKGVGCRV